MRRKHVYILLLLLLGMLFWCASCKKGISAQEVSAKISALPGYYELDLKDEELVLDARDSYDSLANSEKEDVRNYVRLSKLLTRLDELKIAKASDCVACIARLPNEVSLSDEAVIVAARLTYEALSLLGKEHVTNLDVLEEKEALLASEKEAYASARVVNKAISLLPDDLERTKSALDEVLQVSKAYEALSALAQEYVKREYLKKLALLLERRMVILPALSVAEMINQLPSTSHATLSDQDAISEAVSALSTLSDASREFITESEITRLKALVVLMIVYQQVDASTKAEAAAIDEAITNLARQGITTSSGTLLKSIRIRYDSADEETKHAVTELYLLKDLEERYEVLITLSAAEEEAILKVNTLISALPEEPLLSDYEQVKAALSAYEDLSKSSKKAVEGVAKLMRASAIITYRKEAQKIDEMIASINDIPLEEAKSAILEAEEAYESASKDVKAYVALKDELATLSDALARKEDPVGHALKSLSKACMNMFLTTSGMLPMKSEGYPVSWTYADGADQDYYDLETNRVLKVTPLSYLKATLIAKIEDQSIAIPMNLGVLPNDKALIIYNTGGAPALDTSVTIAEGGGSYAEQLATVGFSGLAAVVSDKVYLASKKAVIDITNASLDSEGLVKTSALEPYGAVRDDDGNIIYNAGACGSGAAAYEGTWFIYRNLSGKSVTLNPGYLYGRNKGSYAGFTRVIITPQVDGSFVVSRVLPDWGDDSAPLGVSWSDPVGKVITLEPGEAIICSHSYNADPEYGDSFCANVGVLAEGVTLRLVFYTLD